MKITISKNSNPLLDHNGKPIDFNAAMERAEKEASRKAQIAKEKKEKEYNEIFLNSEKREKKRKKEDKLEQELYNLELLISRNQASEEEKTRAKEIRNILSHE